MRTPTVLVIACVLAASAAIPLRAQSPVAPPAATAQQQSAIAAMQQSIARQRDAAQKQAGQPSAESFFVLPRPASIGATSPLPIAFPSTDCEPLATDVVDPLIKDAAKNQDVSEDLIRSVIKQESGFRPCAVSSKGAQGLMQIMPATGLELGLKDPFDAAQNIETGARFLKQMLLRYNGDLPRALGAYNAGPAKVDAAGGVPDIRETQDYVKQLLSTLPGKQ